MEGGRGWRIKLVLLNMLNLRCRKLSWKYRQMGFTVYRLELKLVSFSSEVVVKTLKLNLL